MPRQFTLRTLLVAMLVVAAFFGGIRFEGNGEGAKMTVITSLIRLMANSVS